jgi:hypothetical protein
MLIRNRREAAFMVGMKWGIVALISISGGSCAASGAFPTTGRAGTTLQLEERSGDDARRVFPSRVSEARLDSADRFAHRVWSEHAGSVSAEVRLCVRPNGTTESVLLLETSGLLDYDIAVVEGVAQWRYEPFAAPAKTLLCRAATVTYNAK